RTYRVIAEACGWPVVGVLPADCAPAGTGLLAIQAARPTSVSATHPLCKSVPPWENSSPRRARGACLTSSAAAGCGPGTGRHHYTSAGEGVGSVRGEMQRGGETGRPELRVGEDRASRGQITAGNRQRRTEVRQPEGRHPPVAGDRGRLAEQHVSV